MTNLSKNAPRRVFTSFFELFPQLLNFFSKSTEKGFGFQRLKLNNRNEQSIPLVDPQKYIFLPTANGLVSLADRRGVEDFARKVLLNNEEGQILLKPIGGVLNDVYLVEAISRRNKKRVLIKRFKDWSGIKWFPLSVWALGAQTFAVLGRSRLEKEIAMSELLRKEGFDVPRVLHVNLSQRLVFMEYIEGEDLSSGLKRIADPRNKGGVMKEFAVITEVGEKLARVHSLEVTLGDTKPENVIVDAAGKVYLLDFEQASTAGDKAWDVAEFLYYSGHFLSPMRAKINAKSIAEAFISGYLKAGG
ncbi:TPA: hypothetical protein HA273_02255, partial [Candidatus Bathyarchaeota archaeon]|nr:hypothetical protein [Candidatus Bathyarchaeota archaeon]